MERTQSRRTLCNKEWNLNCGPVRKLWDTGDVDFGLDTLIFLFSVLTIPISGCRVSNLIPGSAQWKDVISLLSSANVLSSHSSENSSYISSALDPTPGGLHTAIPNSPRGNQLTPEAMAFPVLSNQDAVKDFYRIHSNFWNSKSCISFFPKKRKEQKQKNTNQKKNQIKPKQLSVSARCIYCLPTKKNWSFLVSGWLYIKVRIMKKWFLQFEPMISRGTVEFGEGQSRSLRSQGTSFTHFYHKYLLLC